MPGFWRLQPQRRLAQRALEEEDLVGQAQRVGVEEVDLHLAGTDLVDQRVDVQLHALAVGVDVLEQRVELVDRVDRVGLARGLAAPAAADRRLQRHVGVGVARHQVELELGRHHRRPSPSASYSSHTRRSTERGAKGTSLPSRS